MFCCALHCVYCSLQSSSLEKADCFALFVLLMSGGKCVVLPHGGTGLSAVCDCGIS